MAIKLLAGTLRGLNALTNRRKGGFKFLLKPAQAVGRGVLFFILLPLYKRYTVLKKSFNRFYAPHVSRHRLIHPFSRRYVSHVIIIIIVFCTLAANLNANEVRQQDVTSTSLIVQVVNQEDLGSLQEEGPITETKKVTKYLGQTGVATKPQLANPDYQEIEPSTTVGGSAVVSRILSPVEEQLRQRDEIVYYTVQPGDTISQIAEQFGVSVNTILWENNLSAYKLIRPGDKLAILPQSGIRHKVARGDTIASIAKKYKVESSDIVSANRLASADDVRIGESLFIPGGTPPPAPQTTYVLRSLNPTTAAVSSTAGPPKVVTESGMTWPNSCRRISQYFRLLHSGVDIACPFGSDIYAADGGTVIKAQGGYNGGYGIMIEIDHGNGLVTLYGHLSKLYVEAGDTVEKGEVIAAEGSTGRSTGPHLHFEVRSGGSRKNPLYYVN